MAIFIAVFIDFVVSAAMLLELDYCDIRKFQCLGKCYQNTKVITAKIITCTYNDADGFEYPKTFIKQLFIIFSRFLYAGYNQTISVNAYNGIY